MRRRLVALGLLLLTFVVGALSGMAAEEGFGLDWFDFLDDDRDSGGGQLLAGLGLTPEQRQRAEDILERQEDRLENYWHARLPEIRHILEQSYSEIRAGLNPEQLARFDQRVRDLGGRVPDEIRD
jgi:Spy/CpxP family protein refolding chaperone